MTPNRQVLEVWGDLACFTQPTTKVERFSYPLIPPSAARSIFDAIYCKPTKFRWQVVQVDLLTPIRYIALRRNEVKDRAPNADIILRWAEGREEPQPLFADGDSELLGTDAKGRTQRQTIALKKVRYRLHAEIRPWKEYQGDLPALEAQFRRRAQNGQCFWHPYFGCREFPAYFALAEEDTPTFALDMQLGWMLYDVFDLSRRGTNTDAPYITLFQAMIQQGVMRVPEFDSAEVKKPPQGGSHA